MRAQDYEDSESESETEWMGVRGAAAIWSHHLQGRAPGSVENLSLTTRRQIAAEKSRCLRCRCSLRPIFKTDELNQYRLGLMMSYNCVALTVCNETKSLKGILINCVESPPAPLHS